MLWAEARGETEIGKRAVAHVALNRVKHPRFPNTLNEVLTQRGQFVRKRGKGTLWERIKELVFNLGSDPTNGALYFATYRAWPHKKYHGKIGSHHFFS